MRICPECKTQNAEGSLLCSRCGRSLSDISSAASTTVSAAPATLGAPTSSVVTPASASAATGAAGPAFAQSSEYEEGTPYKSSGRVEPAGVPMLLLGSLVAALFVGGVYCVISNYFDLLIIFPLAAGFIGGFLISMIVKSAKIRNAKFAGLCGLLAGLLIFGIVDVGHAFMERAEMVDAFTEYSMDTFKTNNIDQNGKPLPMSEAELAKLQKTVHDSYDQKLTPLKTVRLYEVMTAENGMTIKRNGVGSGFTVSGTAFWALHGVELLCIAGACMAVAAGAAGVPFCERCSQWQNATDVLKVHPIQNKLVLEKVDARDWKGLAETPVGGPLDNKTQTTVKVTKCPTCGCGTVGVTSTRAVPGRYAHINIGPESVKTLMTPPAVPPI